jgi:hypothetical protein
MKPENVLPRLKASSKKPIGGLGRYIKPKLIKYGDVAKLTAGSSGDQGDHGTKRHGS